MSQTEHRRRPPSARADYDRRANFLLSALGTTAKRRFAERLAPLGLHPQHFAVLQRVAAVDGLSQQEVVDLTGVRRAVMVGLVDDLEAMGLLERRRHPTDRRVNALHATAQTRRLLARADREAQALDDELLAPLAEDDRERFLELLRQVADGAGLAGGAHPDDGEAPGRLGGRT